MHCWMIDNLVTWVVQQRASIFFRNSSYRSWVVLSTWMSRSVRELQYLVRQWVFSEWGGGGGTGSEQYWYCVGAVLYWYGAVR